MNKEERNTDDILRGYLGKTEKAPDGFTLKTMTRIMIEKQPAQLKVGFLRRNMVPIVSLAVTLILILVSVLSPAGENGSSGSELWTVLTSLRITLPSVDISFLDKLILPMWVKYSMIVIAAFAIIDKALLSIFSRKDDGGWKEDRVS